MGAAKRRKELGYPPRLLPVQPSAQQTTETISRIQIAAAEINADQIDEVLATMTDDLDSISIHEAGHALMCDILGVPFAGFKGVAIKKDGGVRGGAVVHDAVDGCNAFVKIAPEVALIRQSLIAVAGKAAETVMLGHSIDGGEITDKEQYIEAHSHLSKHQASLQWDRDFQMAVRLFDTIESRKALKEIASIFRDFITSKVDVDTSALSEKDRMDERVHNLVERMVNQLVGPNADVEELTRYNAARMVAFKSLGVPAEFVGPHVVYKDSAKYGKSIGGKYEGKGYGDQTDGLRGVLGEVVPTNNWIEKVMKTGDKDTLLKIGVALVIGFESIPKPDEHSYYGNKFGETQYKLNGRLTKLWARYDSEFKKSVEKTSKPWTEESWKERRKLEDKVTNRVYAAARAFLNLPATQESIKTEQSRIKKIVLGGGLVQ